jgi:hypothetical protein
MTTVEEKSDGGVVASHKPLSIRGVGLAQRNLLWVVFAAVAINGGYFAGVLPPIAIWLVIPFQLYSVYKLSRALQMSTGASVAWLVAMLIPLVGLICLLVLNGKATRVLKQAGIRVGLMGTRGVDLPAD